MILTLQALLQEFREELPELHNQVCSVDWDTWLPLRVCDDSKMGNLLVIYAVYSMMYGFSKNESNLCVLFQVMSVRSLAEGSDDPLLDDEFRYDVS